jgi:ArsR family transcriptional regulator
MNNRKYPTQAEALTLKVFKVLGEPNRLCMLRWLSESSEPNSVREVAKCCDVDLSVVSRHLSLMKEAGVLKAEKRGKEVYYSVNASVVQTLRALADYLENCCQPKKGKS